MNFSIFLILLAIPIAFGWIFNALNKKARVVLDTKTGLEWYAGNFKERRYAGAHLWIEYLNEVAFRGGGWRLPTMQELADVLLPRDVRMEFESALAPRRSGMVFSNMYCQNDGTPSSEETEFVLCRRIPGGEQVVVSTYWAVNTLAVRSTKNSDQN